MKQTDCITWEISDKLGFELNFKVVDENFFQCFEMACGHDVYIFVYEISEFAISKTSYPRYSHLPSGMTYISVSSFSSVIKIYLKMFKFCSKYQCDQKIPIKIFTECEKSFEPNFLNRSHCWLSTWWHALVRHWAYCRRARQLHPFFHRRVPGRLFLIMIHN